MGFSCTNGLTVALTEEANDGRLILHLSPHNDSLFVDVIRALQSAAEVTGGSSAMATGGGGASEKEIAVEVSCGDCAELGRMFPGVKTILFSFSFYFPSPSPPLLSLLFFFSGD
jgi:hypothetical protein